MRVEDLAEKHKNSKEEAKAKITIKFETSDWRTFYGIRSDASALKLTGAMVRVKMPKTGDFEDFDLMNKEQVGARAAFKKFYEQMDGVVPIPDEFFYAFLQGCVDFSGPIPYNNWITIISVSHVANKWSEGLKTTLSAFAKNSQLVLEYRTPDNHIHTILLDEASLKI